MKKIGVILAVIAVAATAGLIECAAQAPNMKLNPESTGYPLIRPMPYKTPTGDPYQASFGVRRMLTGRTPIDYVDTLIESLNFLQAYGTYGVLGRGEEVFTAKAATYRRLHQGR